MSENKMYRWIVALDVDPAWVADGFDLTDDRAKSMLNAEITGAYDDELNAIVISAPPPLKIVREQGYGPKHPQAKREIQRLLDATPNSHALDRALVKAIALLDSVAFVREESDNTQEVLTLLRGALDTVRGSR